MNNILQAFSYNGLILVASPRKAEINLLLVVSHLALGGSLRVVDGGNHFNVQILSRLIRRKTNKVEDLLNRIYISRAFTCYQMEKMLAEHVYNHWPFLVIDLLNTFTDESLNDDQSHFLMEKCVGHLKRISRTSPVMVSISPAIALKSRPFLVHMLLDVADSHWEWLPKTASKLQMPLWE